MERSITSQDYAAYENINEEDVPTSTVSIRVADRVGVYTQKEVYSFNPGVPFNEQMLDINAFISLAITGKQAQGTGLDDACLLFSFDQYPRGNADLYIFRYQRWVFFTKNAIYICNIFGGDNPVINVYTTRIPDSDVSEETINQECIDQISYIGSIASDQEILSNAPVISVHVSMPRTINDYIVGLVRYGSTASPVVPECRPTYEMFSTQPESLDDFISPYPNYVVSGLLGMIHRGFAHVTHYDLPLRLPSRN